MTADLDRLAARACALAADDAGLLDVAYRTIDTPVGPLLLAATDRGLVRVAYAARGPRRGAAALADRISPRVLRAPARLDAAARQLDEYFAGRRTAFDLPLDLRLSAGFRRDVLRHCARSATATTAELRRRRGGRRQPEGGARRGHRLRDQPAAGRRALPPGGAHRRRARRLPRRRRGQAHPARPWRRRHERTAWTPLDWRWRRSPRSSTTYGSALTAPRARRRTSAGRSPRSTTTPTGSARPSTWPATGSARAVPLLRPPAARAVVAAAAAFYPHLLPIARRLGGPGWAGRPRGPTPSTSGWTCATPPGRPSRPRSCSRYGAGDWNALHRDLYGELVFPLQVVIGLDEPGVDHTGGEFLIVEQRPRAQSRGTRDPAAGPRARLHHPRPAGRARPAAGRPRRCGTG